MERVLSKDNPFSTNQITSNIESGTPVIEEAKSSIEEFVSSEKPGDHEIVFARVLGSYVHDDEGSLRFISEVWFRLLIIV